MTRIRTNEGQINSTAKSQLDLTQRENQQHNTRVLDRAERELRKFVNDAAEKHSTGVITLEIRIRDGKAQRITATPLAVEIS